MELVYYDRWLTLSLPSSRSTFSQPVKRKCLSDGRWLGERVARWLAVPTSITPITIPNHPITIQGVLYKQLDIQSTFAWWRLAADSQNVAVTTMTPFVRQTDKCILYSFHEYEYLSPYRVNMLVLFCLIWYWFIMIISWSSHNCSSGWDIRVKVVEECWGRGMCGLWKEIMQQFILYFHTAQHCNQHSSKIQPTEELLWLKLSGNNAKSWSIDFTQT